MKKTDYILISAFCASAVIAQGFEKPSFSGTWVLEGDHSERLIVAQANSEIHVQETASSLTTADYKCNLEGKDCPFKEDGHAGKVTFWFNGPKLVELKTHGSKVVRRRFKLLDEGKKLEVEFSAVSPPGKTEVLSYVRE